LTFVTIIVLFYIFRKCCGHVWGTGLLHTGFKWGDLRGRDHIEELGVDGRRILKWIFRKWDGSMYYIYLAQDRGQMTGACECGNEPSGSIKCGEFLD
jgi:hypothetical protein